MLFWICGHYSSPNGESSVVLRFEKSDCVDVGELAVLKKGMVAYEGDFIKTEERTS